MKWRTPRRPAPKERRVRKIFALWPQAATDGWTYWFSTVYRHETWVELTQFGFWEGTKTCKEPDPSWPRNIT
jgi:hypothetical protein